VSSNALNLWLSQIKGLVSRVERSGPYFGNPLILFCYRRQNWIWGRISILLKGFTWVGLAVVCQNSTCDSTVINEAMLNTVNQQWTYWNYALEQALWE